MSSDLVVFTVIVKLRVVIRATCLHTLIFSSTSLLGASGGIRRVNNGYMLAQIS